MNRYQGNRTRTAEEEDLESGNAQRHVPHDSLDSTRALSIVSQLGFFSEHAIDVDTGAAETMAQQKQREEEEIVFAQSPNRPQKRRVSFDLNAEMAMIDTEEEDTEATASPLLSPPRPRWLLNGNNALENENDVNNNHMIGEFSDVRGSINWQEPLGKNRRPHRRKGHQMQHLPRPALERRNSSARPMEHRWRYNLKKNTRNLFGAARPKQRQPPQEAAWESSLAGGESTTRQRRLKVSERTSEHHILAPSASFDDEHPQEDAEQRKKEQGSSHSWWNFLGKRKASHRRSNHGNAEIALPSKQYNLTTDHGQRHAIQMLLHRVGIAFEYDDANGTRRMTCYGMSLDLLVVEYLHWCFRSSFAAVFLSLWFSFLLWTFLFALILWYMGREHPTCIGGVDFETDYFTDAWALSWTTFSTVGYGLIYSGISADEPEIKKCTGITIIMAVESFVGVLFASFLGAIIFAKVARSQSYAQVMFSDPILIRFGTGVLGDHTENDTPAASFPEADVEQGNNESSNGEGNNGSTQPTQSTGDRRSMQQHRQDSMMQHRQQDSIAELAHHGLVPPPVLEFQLVNRLHSVRSGEIMDAGVNIVASIEADQACHTVRDATKRRRKKKGKKGGAKQRGGGSGSPMSTQGSSDEGDGRDDDDDEHDDHHDLMHDVTKFSTILKSFENSEPTHVSFEEDPTGHLVPHRIFSRLEVETENHPFLKRIWTVRHILDANSPLLTTAAREIVTSCGGLWPKDITNAKYVRQAIQFDQLLVSFSGTSNADANTVYAQKIYDYDALNVGYRFVNMLYRDRMTGRVTVDTSLMNDVVEQVGGGGEDLHNPSGADSVTVSPDGHRVNVLHHSGSIRNMLTI